MDRFECTQVIETFGVRESGGDGVLLSHEEVVG